MLWPSLLHYTWHEGFFRAFFRAYLRQVAANLLLVKNTTLHGVFWGSYMMNQPRVLHESMAQVGGTRALGGALASSCSRCTSRAAAAVPLGS